MRILTTIRTSFADEHLAAVQPDLAPEVADHWNVRLNLYTGRALSDTALRQEQRGRAGRLATIGQLVSPGIVSGLEVSLERGEEATRPRYYYQIAAGMGLTASGEDVIVRRPLRVNVLDVQVCGPALLFAATDEVPIRGQCGGAPADKVAHQVGGPTLGRLLQERADQGIPERDAPYLPRVGVLLLQPVQSEELFRAADAADAWEDDPQNFAFEDQQIVDGSRLLWYVWPTEWRCLPKADRLRRNQLAYTIFDAEQANGPDDLLPWEHVGVPLALVAFNRRWKPLFADRNAVARAGGKPPRRTPAIANVGNPFLWQARLEQFAEHVAEISVPVGPLAQSWDGAHFDMQAYAAPALWRQFRFLPPAGPLPRAVLNFTTRRQSFFPSTYRVDALPVPLEQLDVAMEGSAALAPFDTFVPDEVQILVPVPQPWFEPALLNEEAVSPTFNETIDALVLRRSKWLLRRLVVRQRKAVIDRAIEGREEFYPDVDPRALDAAEAVETNQVDPTVPELAAPERTFGTNEEGLDLVSTGLMRLRDYLSEETPLYNDVSRAFFDLEKTGIRPDIDSRAAEIAASEDLSTDAARARTGGEFREELVRQMPAVLKGKVTYDAARRHLLYTARAEPMSDTEWQQLRALSTDADYVNAVDRLAGRAAPVATVGAFVPRVREPFAALTAISTLRTIGLPRVRIPRIPSDRAPLDALPFPKRRLAEVASGKVWYDEVAKQLVFTPRREPMTIAERDALLTAPPPPAPDAGSPLVRAAIHARVFLAQPPSYVAAVHALYERSQQNEVMQLERLGLRRFIDYLEKKIAAADDKIDLSFARVQADIYRLRQLMLGSNAATRLATSPALASIAQGESAVATQENLERFIQEAKAASTVDMTKLPTEVTYAPPVISSRIDPERSDDIHIGTVGGKTAARGATNTFAAALLTARAPATTAGALPVAGRTKAEVVGQAPIVGRALDFRSVTVAERLEQPKAPEAKDSAIATKAGVIEQLAAPGINVDDLDVPGFNVYDADARLVVAEFKTVEERVRRVIPEETRHNFLEITGRRLATEILQGYHDLDPVDGDESAFFAVGVRALDHAVAVLRIVEGRIQAYNTALQRCRQTLAELERFSIEADERLDVIEGELTETRHDIGVARALLAEETTRVAGVNDRRRRIISEHVPYLAFRRPRSRDLLEDVPLRHLDPAAIEPVIPTCLTRRVDAPRELRAMTGLLREVPVRWFTHVSNIVDRLDRLEMIERTLQYAKVRAAAQSQVMLPSVLATKAPGVGIGASITRVVSVHQSIVSNIRAQVAQLDLSDFAAQSWLRARDRAREALSLGDLSDADHGRSEVARSAAQEVEMISRVAACLYERFGAVTPQIRLAWAQQLSQYDDPVNLRNLATLPRWDAIEYLDRRELQGLADWLFERIDPKEPRALALMSDLVRLCILLASHAPVNEIVAGHVHRPAAVQKGTRVELVADVAKVHVGMQVLMYADAAAGAQVVARGVVEDLGDGKASARVVHAASPTVSLSANARVQFVEPEHPDLTPVETPGVAAKPGPSTLLGGIASAFGGRY